MKMVQVSHYICSDLTERKTLAFHLHTPTPSTSAVRLSPVNAVEDGRKMNGRDNQTSDKGYLLEYTEALSRDASPSLLKKFTPPSRYLSPIWIKYRDYTSSVTSNAGAQY
jgi:hypothetical protein